VSELQGLQLSLPELRARGVRVFGVSVDPVDTNAELARDAGLEFALLSDPELRAADAYGVRHRDGHDGHDIALSASVLVDADGIVRWTYVTPNLRERPSTETVLAAVDALPPRR
jgi:peroxiredoxin